MKRREFFAGAACMAIAPRIGLPDEAPKPALLTAEEVSAICDEVRLLLPDARFGISMSWDKGIVTLGSIATGVPAPIVNGRLVPFDCSTFDKALSGALAATRELARRAGNDG